MIDVVFPGRRERKGLAAQLTRAARDVLGERFRQIAKFGHVAEADDRLPRSYLLRQAHVRLIDAEDLIFGNATAEELQRARRRTVQAAALCLAAIDRLDREIQAKGEA